MNIYKLYTDGSQMSYFKQSSIGGYLLDFQKKTVFEYSQTIEGSKNDLNKFEILSLEHGLKKSLEHGVKHIQCFSDDKTLCEILTQQDLKLKQLYVSRNPYLNRIFNILPNFDSIEFNYLPRKLNKKADNLARSAITDKINKDDTFQVSNLLFYQKINSKEIFFEIKNTYSNYFVFNLKPILKPKLSYVEQAYFVQKNNNDIQVTLLSEINVGTNTNYKNRLTFINQILSQASENLKCHPQDAKIGLTIMCPSHLEKIKSILKGTLPISNNLTSTMKSLSDTLTSFKEVLIHEDNKIINHLFPKAPEPIELNKIEVLNAMKILGHHTYTLGKNLPIENYFSIPQKMKDVSEDEKIGFFQKKYFTEFLKLSARENALEKTHLKTPLDVVKIKEELTQQGVNFRIKL